MKKRKSRKKKVAEAILTVLGTVVVAATFYAHEVKRERAREAKDRIEHAKDEKNLRDLLNAVQRRIIRVLDLDRNKKQHSTAKPGNIEYERKQADEMRLNATKYWLRVDDSRVLAESLHNRADLDSRIEATEKELLHVEDECDDLYEDIGMLTEGGAIPTASQLKERDDKFKAISEKYDEFSEAASSLVEEIDEEVRDEANAAQLSYKNATTVSYYLYPLGFLLALVGKLIGIEINDGTD